MSNGQTALPDTAKFCQTKKIKARHRYNHTAYNHTACESAGCTGESGPARSCTPPWHFNVDQMLIQSIADQKPLQQLLHLTQPSGFG